MKGLVPLTHPPLEAKNPRADPPPQRGFSWGLEPFLRTAATIRMIRAHTLRQRIRHRIRLTPCNAPMARTANTVAGSILLLTSLMASCNVEVLDVTFEAGTAGHTPLSSSGGQSSLGTTSSTRTQPAMTLASATAGASGGANAPFGGFAGSVAGSFAGGGAAPITSINTSLPWRSGLRPSPFCELTFGARRDALGRYLDPRKPASFPSIQFLSVLTGGEDSNVLGDASLRMLFELQPDSSSSLRDKTPVFYAPLIAFKAHAQDGLEFCGVDSPTTLCSEGAEWIRNNRDYLREVYDSYALDIANVWGTTQPLIWLFEPGFSEYLASSQSSPLSLKELDAVTSDLIGRIRSRLPHAWISLHGTAQIEDLFAYFGAIDLSLVHMVNVTGTATSERIGSATDNDNPDATYANLSAATGLPIFVDTGFGEAAIENHGWLTSEPDLINARIKDGVFAVLVDPLPADIDTLVEELRPQLRRPYCE